MMRAKNKQSFFALHQIQSKIKNIDPDIRVEFHILWDNKDEYGTEDGNTWAELIETQIENLYSYDRTFFKKYVSEVYRLDYNDKFDTWYNIYHLLMAHYLRRVLCKDYYIVYDDDIIINDDFREVVQLALDHTPALLSEPMNVNCDKVLLQSLVDLLGENFYHQYQARNPNFYGFNAGFQGIDLSIYDEFLSKDRFNLLLDLFQYESVLDENGKEFFGPKRFLIDTQQQSFFSLMNTVLSRKDPHILNPEEYYVIPNFGTHPTFGELSPSDGKGGWGPALRSKIVHFIGHTQGKGKPIQFLDKVDEYLRLNKFI